MQRLFPLALRPGDTLALVAPASPVEPEPVERAIKRLEQRGFRIKTYGDLYRKYGYLAGEDSVRAEEMMAAWADPEVAAVLPVRGGNGVPRILDLLDYDLIRKNPKVFVGFSDNTALHLALQNRSGLVTFHGPHPKDGIGATDGFSELAEATWSRALLADNYAAGEEGFTIAVPDAAQEAIQMLSSGVGRGRLTGGNLALVCAMMGTPYEIETQGSILLLEDIAEVPYRVDRMLCQLKLAGKLQQLAGAVLGQFTDCDPPGDSASLSLQEVFEHYFGSLGIPVIQNYPSGHCRDNATLPLNVEVELDAERCTITLLENPVALSHDS